MTELLSEEHRAFRDGARRFVEAELPKTLARALEKDEAHYPFVLWEKFTQAGFHGSASTKPMAARAATS